MALSSRPNFSGLWHCDVEHSTFRGEQPARIVAKIDHAGSKLTLEMHVTYKDGRESAMTFHIDTEGARLETRFHPGARTGNHVYTFFPRLFTFIL